MTIVLIKLFERGNKNLLQPPFWASWNLVELPFRINFSAKQKVERLRIPSHLKAAKRQTV